MAQAYQAVDCSCGAVFMRWAVCVAKVSVGHRLKACPLVMDSEKCDRLAFAQ